nr:5E5 antigen-like [Setaria viridis]
MSALSTASAGESARDRGDSSLVSVCSDRDLTVVLGETLSQVPPAGVAGAACSLLPALSPPTDVSASAVALDPGAGARTAGSSLSLKGLPSGTLALITAGASWRGGGGGGGGTTTWAAAGGNGRGRGGGLGARRLASSSRETAPPPLGRNEAPQRWRRSMSCECAVLPPTCPAGRPHAGTRSGRTPPCPSPPGRRRLASRRRSSAITAESVAPGDGGGAGEGEEAFTSMPIPEPERGGGVVDRGRGGDAAEYAANPSGD